MKTKNKTFVEFPRLQESIDQTRTGVSCFNGTASRIIFNAILRNKVSRMDRILYLHPGNKNLGGLVKQANVTLKELRDPREVKFIEFSQYDAVFMDCFDLMERNIDNLPFCEDLVRNFKTCDYETPKFFLGDERLKFNYLITIQDNMCDLLVTANVSDKGFYETAQKQPIVLYIEKDRFFGNNNLYGIYTYLQDTGTSGNEKLVNF